MNERIKELAERAQHYAEYTTPQGLEWFTAFKEKFAELIIDECLAECWYDYTPLQISDNIKTKFGVK